MTERRKISNVDALGILAMGALVRYGAPLGGLLLQLAAIVAGVVGVLALVWQRPIAAVALFPVAGVCWWFGDRLHAVTRCQPLNQMLDNPPSEPDKKA